jgi:hypothetical protein
MVMIRVRKDDVLLSPYITNPDDNNKIKLCRVINDQNQTKKIEIKKHNNTNKKLLNKLPYNDRSISRK